MDKKHTQATRPPTMPEQVEVIDCTLRDGEQTPGVWFTVQEKVQLALLLDQAGIRVLDAGFPAASAADMEAMQEMRRAGVRARLGATARPVRQDIVAAAKAGSDEVFMFMPTSDLRIKETLGVTRDDVSRIMRTGVDEIVGQGMTASVVFEDSTRADPQYMIRLVNDVCQPGTVARLILADSVGCAHPASMRRLVRTLAEQLDPSIAISIHAHNDYGLATANALAAIEAGARSLSCTVNGIGERAGNADLAECLAAMTHLHGIEHGVDALKLPELSRFVERASGIHMSATKPVTGFNVYRHESGVHVDSMLKNTRSYEELPPSWTGSERDYVFGKHSGASLVRHVLSTANPPREVDDDLARKVVEAVKRIVEETNKNKHERAFEAKVAFTETALAGVPSEVVIAEYDRLAGEAVS
ncbi:LeuA family protein [Actinophytocola sp.]|uniref:LeuA family protein n=1 Tax=Actinophytocola sp. TaxID=1872138 RepID=UPI003D6BF887